MISSGNSEYISKSVSSLKVDCLTQLSESDFDEILRIISQKPELKNGLKFIVEKVCQLSEDTLRHKLAEKLAKLEAREIILPGLIGSKLPACLTDKIAFYGFSDAKVMKQSLI